MHWMSLGRDSISGQQKLSVTGMMLHRFSKAHTISWNTTARATDIDYLLNFKSRHKRTYLVHPVDAVDIIETSVKGVWGKYKDKVCGGADWIHQFAIETSALQTLNVQEDVITLQLKMNLQEACQLGPIGSSVGDENIDWASRLKHRTS